MAERVAGRGAPHAHVHVLRNGDADGAGHQGYQAVLRDVFPDVAGHLGRVLVVEDQAAGFGQARRGAVLQVQQLHEVQLCPVRAAVHGELRQELCHRGQHVQQRQVGRLGATEAQGDGGARPRPDSPPRRRQGPESRRRAHQQLPARLLHPRRGRGHR